MSFINVQNISKRYADKKVLDDINFQMQSGDIVGLLGLNGAGKTTLIKILSGVLPPTKGNVNLFGVDISKDKMRYQSMIGYLPENNPLYLDMYVKEYLLFCARLYRKKLKNITDVIERLDLVDVTNKRIRMLSKGYRQRVGIASSILHYPDFLILDEPTTGLDFNQAIAIRKIIKEMGKKCTILMSSHIQEEIKEVCNRILLIKQGSIISDIQVDKTMDLKEMIN